MSKTVIKPCSCSSSYQDKMYGAGMRVHNTKVLKNGTTLRCTVCKKEK